MNGLKSQFLAGVQNIVSAVPSSFDLSWAVWCCVNCQCKFFFLHLDAGLKHADAWRF